MGIEVRRSDDRFVTESGGRTTFHSFSFGPHYDARNLGFASMVALNDENLPPGTGYEAHQHSNLEIVTWVLEGALRHTDGDGNSRVLHAGEVQRISAGDGIVHAEVTEPGTTTRFLQTWLRPEVPGGAPSYAVGGGISGSELAEVVGPDGLALGTAGARLLVAHVATGTLVLPDAPQLHLFAVGAVVGLGDHELTPGDAARLTDQGGRELYVAEPGPVAVWAFG
jgi:hypothetical protein